MIKLNYILTITNETIIKTVFHLGPEKKRLVFEELAKRMQELGS